MPIRPTHHLLSLTALFLLPTFGCNKKSSPTPENYIKGLNAYYVDRTECLLPDTRFPFSTSDPAEMKRMETLVASQLLTESHETAIKVTRYVPTTLGEKYAPKFCYGHRVVTAIDSSTPPAVANGFNETQVIYRYKIADTPHLGQIRRRPVRLPRHGKKHQRRSHRQSHPRPNPRRLASPRLRTQRLSFRAKLRESAVACFGFCPCFS